MATPRHIVNSQFSHPSPAESRAVDDSYLSHRGASSLAETSPNPAKNPADLASTEKTRAALLQLGDSPRDASPLAELWDENRSSIEHELHIHLYSDSNSPLLEQLLARMIWQAAFFCDEVDDPKAWVARCANLEARRLALQLREAR